MKSLFKKKAKKERQRKIRKGWDDYREDAYYNDDYEDSDEYYGDEEIDEDGEYYGTDEYDPEEKESYEDDEEYYEDDEYCEDDEEYYEDDEEYYEDYDEEDYDEDDEYENDRHSYVASHRRRAHGMKGAAQWFMNLGTTDHVIMFTGLIVVILLVVTGTLYFNARGRQEQIETFAQVGEGLEDIPVIGEKWLVAIADAEAARLMAAMEQEQPHGRKAAGRRMLKQPEKKYIFS